MKWINEEKQKQTDEKTDAWRVRALKYGPFSYTVQAGVKTEECPLGFISLLNLTQNHCRVYNSTKNSYSSP